MGEAADFPNAQDEVAGTTSPAPPINQNIIVAANMFITDRSSSVDAQADSSNAALGPRQYPVTVHDATRVFFDELSAYASWLPNETCDASIMLALSTPPPVITAFPPIACRVAATTSGLEFAAP